MDFRHFFFLGGKETRRYNQLCHLRLVDCRDGEETGSPNPMLTSADNGPLLMREKKKSQYLNCKNYARKMTV